MVKKTQTKNIKTIEKVVRKILELLEIEAKLTVVKEEDVFQIQLETADPGVLIGYHGETLRALQRMVAMIVYRQTAEWLKIVVNVGDYRQRRQESLEKMALSASQKVKLTQQSQALPPMPSAERRIIHLILAEEPGVETISEGEGRERHVVIRPK
jgi:spoIIIJ-associated protein